MNSSFSTQRRPRTGLLTAGVLLVLALLLAACGNSGTTTTGSGSGTTPTVAPQTPTVTPPNDLLTPGTLTVGSDTTYPPQEYINTSTGQPAGFDIDLITAVAQRMGLKTHVVSTGFDTIIDGLVAKRFDVVISAVTINSDREKKVQFVPYFNAGESLLVQKSNPHNIKSLSDLCGLAVGVQSGTVEQTDLQTASQSCKTAGKSAINMTILQDQTAVVQLLATNRVIATYQDSPVTDYYIQQNPGQFEVGGQVFNAAPEGIVIRKGDTSMFDTVQTAFNSLKSDGTYRKLINKWNLSDEAISMIDRRSQAVA